MIKHDTVISKAENPPTEVIPLIEKQKVIEKPKTEKLTFTDKPKQAARNIVPKPQINKPKPLVTEKKPKPKQEDLSKNNKPKPPVIEKPPVAKEELYSIEVYSTPNIDDAEQWLAKLSKRGITAALTQQKIRGVIWYKVRYGKFPTRNEAKESAIKNGFSRSWIDRLK